MSMDWIKVRECIHEDPAVLRMAANLGTRPEHIVSYCVKFWSWLSRNCHAGSVTGVTLVSLECVLNLPGFCDELCKVGWLEYSEADGEPLIKIPNFERHLSQGAKARALARNRQRSARSQSHADVTNVSRSERDKSATRERERVRERDIYTHTHGDGSFSDLDQTRAEAVDRWCSYRESQTGQRPADEVISAILRERGAWSPEQFSAAVDFSIARQAKSILDPAISFEKAAAERASHQRLPGKPKKNYSIPQLSVTEDAK